MRSTAEQPHSCHQPAHPKYTPLGMAVFAPGFPKTRPGPPSKSKQCALTRVRQSSGSRFAVGKPCSQPRPRNFRAELTMRRTCAAELQGRPRLPGKPASQVLKSRAKAAEPAASQPCTTSSCAPQCAVGKTWHTLLPDVLGNARCVRKQTTAVAGSPAAHQVPAAAAKTLDHLGLPAHRLRFPPQVGAMGAPSAARLHTATPGSEKGTLPSSAAVLLGAGRQGRQRQLMACSVQLTAAHASGCQQARVCRQTYCWGALTVS